MEVKSERTEYLFPKLIDEACKLKEKFGAGGRFIAGGTDLLLLLDQLNEKPKVLIDINRIPELKTFTISDSLVTIGAAVTYNEILENNELCQQLPFLEKAIRSIGGVQVRNMATLVGNIANASPAGDSLPTLYVLKAKVCTTDGTSQREIAIEDFILGVRKINLKPNELISHIKFKLPKPGFRGEFEKIGLRKAMAISLVSLALLISLDELKIDEIYMALGSVAPTVVNVGGLDAIIGKPLNQKTIAEIAAIAANNAKPIDDVRGSAEYRRMAITGMVKRSLNKFIDKN